MDEGSEERVLAEDDVTVLGEPRSCKEVSYLWREDVLETAVDLW